MEHIELKIMIKVKDPKQEFNWKHLSGTEEIEMTIPLFVTRDINWNDIMPLYIGAAHQQMIKNNQPEPEESDDHTN